MTDLPFTKHGQERMRQRGLRKTDLETILEYGTEIDQDRIMLTGQDVDKIIRFLKREIAKFERLKNKIVVVSDGRLITTYHANRAFRPSHG